MANIHVYQTLGSVSPQIQGYAVLLCVWTFLNWCCVCYDPEIEVKVMSTDATSGNTGLTAFFSRLFFLSTDDTSMIHCFNPRENDSHMKGAGMLVLSLRGVHFGLTWGVLRKKPLFQPRRSCWGLYVKKQNYVFHMYIFNLFYLLNSYNQSFLWHQYLKKTTTWLSETCCYHVAWQIARGDFWHRCKPN